MLRRLPQVVVSGYYRSNPFRWRAVVFKAAWNVKSMTKSPCRRHLTLSFRPLAVDAPPRGDCLTLSIMHAYESSTTFG